MIIQKEQAKFFAPALVLLCLATVSTMAQQKNKQQAKPNIIFILADDMGYGDPSCYGQKKFTTPHIDALAKNGMRFTQAYAGTAVCAPSRSALFTGLTTGHTPIRGNLAVPPEGQYPMPDSVEIIPQMLKKAGYTTGCFGKWGLGYPGSEGDPVNKGFDEFYGYNCQTLAHNYYPYHLWHNKEKIMLPENSGARDGAYAPALIQEQTLKFLEDNKDKPFALFVTTVIPHAEVTAPEKFMAAEAGKFNPETPFAGADPEAPNYKKNGKYTSQPTPHAGYVAMIKVLDGQVGQIMSKLHALGLDKNTLVIFSSDNGPSIEGGEDPLYFNSSGGLRGHKRDLYEGGIREPFIACWPGYIKAGTTTSQNIAFWDVLPTMAAIAGAKINFPIDGISFLPTLTDKGVQPQHDYFYWEFHEQGGSQAVRIGKWKAIRLQVAKNPDGPIELYDLSTDDKELKNVAAENLQIVSKMAAIMKSARVPSAIFNFQPAKVNE